MKNLIILNINIQNNNNLNVTTNANATEYGKVTGMTFLGMYTKPNDNYSFGL